MYAELTATAALVVSGYQLWVAHLRRPRLKVAPPRGFGLGPVRTDEQRVGWILVVPLLMQNTGASPALIADLRLRFANPDCTFMWVARLQGMFMADWKVGRAVATGLVVEAGGAQQVIGEFQCRTPAIAIGAGPRTVVLEALVGTARTWRTIGDFELPTTATFMTLAAEGYTTTLVEPEVVNIAARA